MSKKKPLPQTRRGATKVGKTKAPVKKAPKKKTATDKRRAAVDGEVAMVPYAGDVSKPVIPRIVQGCIGPIDVEQIMRRMARAKVTATPSDPAVAVVAAEAVKLGRPSLYSVEVMSALCGKIAEGMTLTAVCKMDDMPSITTTIRWLADLSDPTKDAFRAAYACARDAWIQQMADEALSIADTQVEGVITKESEDGTEVTTKDMIEHRRLQVETRKWLLSKLAPGKYGDKVTAVLEGGDKPVQVEAVTAVPLSLLSERLDTWRREQAPKPA